MKLQKLIEGAIRADRKSQRELYELFALRVYSIALRYARTPDEAKDFAQEAWLCAFAKLDTFRGEGSFEGWLRHLSANVCISLLRRKGLSISELPEVLPKGLHLEPEALDQLCADEILAQLHHLPEGYRLIFNLVAIEGFSHAEAAASLGISESTSRSQLTRARAAFQRRLAQLHALCL